MAQWSERRAVRVFSWVCAEERGRSELRVLMEDLCKLRACWIFLVSGVTSPPPPQIQSCDNILLSYRGCVLM